MAQFTADLAVGALDHQIWHSLTGCHKSARHAVDLLDALAECTEVDSETRRGCDSMSVALEYGHG